MASQILTVHSQTPEIRKIKSIADALKSGAVILLPTDTGFALGCELSNKTAINRIRTIRKIPESKELTFLCYSLSNIAEFARVSNMAYKTIKRLIPGPITFVLPATKLVPNFAQTPKRNTAGIRVPDNDLAQLILKELGSPLISITAKKDNNVYVHDPEKLVKAFAPLVDVAIRSDRYFFTGESTVIDMTTDEFKIIRHGAGIARVLEYVEVENEL